jgi:two-component system, cell cycle sensor histidine kinase and response regulator CckA
MSRKSGLSGAELERPQIRAPLARSGIGPKDALLRWEQLFEYASWGTVLLGSLGTTMHAANPAYARMHGYTVEELTGRPLEFTLTPAARANLKRNLKMADENGHYIFDSVHVRKDGTTFPVLVDFSTVKDDDGKVLLRWANAQDATEQKRLEQRLGEKQKVESLGRLAGGLAHDFNNLLTAIIGNADLALKMLPADIPARANLVEVIRASEKVADLTRQMLAYSGKGGVVTEPVNLSAEVRAANELLHGSIPKNVRLDLELSDDIPLIDADRSMIQQLIINLVINGAEAVGDQEGTVQVKTRTETEPIAGDVIPGEFGLGDLRPGTYACLEVRDTGCGMDENTLPLIFDPFFTTKFMGRGLGLAAGLGIVLSYHGAIKVQSKLGQGSTFRVFLPVQGGKGDGEKGGKGDSIFAAPAHT